jgi:hypothetical protein
MSIQATLSPPEKRNDLRRMVPATITDITGAIRF